ncbi:hypothetical protein Slin15195_G064340 [Septoria linicola]|uniref:Uncharacterized protein n=1 Tax=Septoria linicola TaxID=215465 RepID=A0A9Q9EJK2_9PEZI|nr:hypothetical protein Slin15195_G064340 [Septoria linicola]
MGVAIFNNGFLLVGERVKDWSEVWYRPSQEPNEGAELRVPIQLFGSSSLGEDPEPRAPMPGEVKWFSQFDIKNMESNDSRERLLMQEQTLYDAWLYMSEMDEREVRGLEQDFNRPKERRWQSWFMHAVRAKRLQFQRAAQVAGVPTVQGSDIDGSLFGADFEDHMQQTIRKRGRMMQPPRRGALDRKRKGNGTPTNARKQKKQKPTSKNARATTATQELEEPAMSGGIRRSVSTAPLLDPTHDLNRPNGLEYILGGIPSRRSMSEGFKGSDNSSSFSHDYEEISDDDDNPAERHSEIYDPSPPEDFRSGSARPVVSPASRLGEGLTGFSMRRQQTHLQRSRSGSVNRGTMPTQPGLGRSDREGSVIGNADRTNSGLSDDDALQHALRASMQPEDLAWIREQTRVSLERDDTTYDVQDGAEMLGDVQDLTDDPVEPEESTDAPVEPPQTDAGNLSADATH